MSRDNGAARAPRFEGEDVSPTTERELRGWYSIGLAAEIYAVCGVGRKLSYPINRFDTYNFTGSFAPVTLEQLARESGVLRSDGVTPCIQAAAKEGTSRLTRLLIRAAESADDKGQCIIRPFGRETSTSSFALYTFSIAVLMQALVLITFSPVADYGICSPLITSVTFVSLTRLPQAYTENDSCLHSLLPELLRRLHS
jgi:UMF1 family MFS transporter